MTLLSTAVSTWQNRLSAELVDDFVGAFAQLEAAVIFLERVGRGDFDHDELAFVLADVQHLSFAQAQSCPERFWNRDLASFRHGGFHTYMV